MPAGVRANSLLVAATPSGLVQSLDEADEYMDRFGVPRRRMSDVAVQRRIVRGFSLSNLDAVRVVYGKQDLHDPEEDDDNEVATSEHEPEWSHDAPLSFEEEIAIERARQARMLRRQRMILELRDRKRTLLVGQHEQILERVQLWNEALALDPEAELTSANTILSPSSTAQTFVDEDGNVRRKSSLEGLETSYKSTHKVAHKSFVLDFVQALIEE